MGANSSKAQIVLMRLDCLSAYIPELAGPWLLLQHSPVEGTDEQPAGLSAARPPDLPGLHGISLASSSCLSSPVSLVSAKFGRVSCWDLDYEVVIIMYPLSPSCHL